MSKGIFNQTLCRPNQHAWIYSSSGTVSECPPDARCECGTYRWDQQHLVNDVPTGKTVELFEWQIGVQLDAKEEGSE